MSPESPVQWKRLAAEFVAITVAVYLGLLADNYREYRLDKVRESEYLALLATDLDSDLETLGYTRQHIDSHAHAAELIHSAIGGQDVTVVDLEKAFSHLFLTWTYERQRPNYLALRNGLGLHVISDHALRSALTQYFEVDQERLQQDYMANYNHAQQRLRVGLGKHVRFFPPDEFGSLSSIPDDLHISRLFSPIPKLAEDIEFMNDIAEVGGRGFELIGQIDQVRAANREIRDKILSASQ
jgi:hypothetical protein